MDSKRVQRKIVENKGNIQARVRSRWFDEVKEGKEKKFGTKKLKKKN